MGPKDPKYRRHPLVWVGLAFLIAGILVRWLLPGVLHVPNAAIQITGVALQGLATACIILGIFKGARRAERKRSQPS